MAAKYKIAAKVQWKWLGRIIEGTVEAVYLESVTKIIKDKKITRHGSKEKPAYLVKSAAGNLALKLESELQQPSKKGPSKKLPRMFD